MDAQQAAARIREALEKFDATTNGRDEARAMGALMNASDPDALRALLAERDELAKDAARLRIALRLVRTFMRDDHPALANVNDALALTNKD